jgi:hypothetical protein
MSFSIPEIDQQMAQHRVALKTLLKRRKQAEREALLEKYRAKCRVYRRYYKADMSAMLAYLESTGVNLTDFQSAANRWLTFELERQ